MMDEKHRNWAPLSLIRVVCVVVASMFFAFVNLEGRTLIINEVHGGTEFEQTFGWPFVWQIKECFESTNESTKVTTKLYSPFLFTLDGLIAIASIFGFSWFINQLREVIFRRQLSMIQLIGAASLLGLMFGFRIVEQNYCDVIEFGMFAVVPSATFSQSGSLFLAVSLSSGLLFIVSMLSKKFGARFGF